MTNLTIAEKEEAGVARYMSEMLTLDPKAKTPCAEVYADYRGWCARERVPLVGPKQLTRLAIRDGKGRIWRGKTGALRTLRGVALRASSGEG